MGSIPGLGVGWRRGKQGGIYSLVDGGGGAAHRKQRQRGGGITSGTRGGEQRHHGVLPGLVLVGKRRKEGMAFVRQGDVRATHRREKK
jgi:hypothetical protein